MIALIAVAALAVLVLISYLIELLRSAPPPPERLKWAPNIPIRYLDLDGPRVRYVVAGSGPPLLLLHTLRTQLDMFQKVIPALADRYTVYALDYPGHGYSDIPRAEYTREVFVSAVAGFLERLNLTGVTVVGESIGGTIALLLAARGNPRVSQVIAINPYDYDRGRGIRRSSALARALFTVGAVPVLGPSIMRLRQFVVENRVFQGGVSRRGSLPSELSREMYRVGNRPGHNRAFRSLLRHAAGWEEARAEYGRISAPVLLLYGENDWSLPKEREADYRAIPNAKLKMVSGAGHFLSLDAPEAVIQTLAEAVPQSALGVTPSPIARTRA